MIRLVAVDVDDTLCMTEAACFDLENEVLRRVGRKPIPRRIHLSTWGEPLLDAMRKRSPGIDLRDFSVVYQVVMCEYIESGRLDVIASDNLAALDRLWQAGRRVMLLTSRTEAEVEHLLAPDHVLAGRIASIYHAGNMRFAKPDPRAFDEILMDVGLEPAECAYVGDSPGDARAASGAGLHFIACLQSGVRRRQDFGASQVDAFIDTFPDIVGVLDRLDDQVLTPTRPQEDSSLRPAV